MESKSCRRSRANALDVANRPVIWPETGPSHDLWAHVSLLLEARTLSAMEVEWIEAPPASTRNEARTGSTGR